MLVVDASEGAFDRASTIAFDSKSNVWIIGLNSKFIVRLNSRTYERGIYELPIVVDSCDLVSAIFDSDDFLYVYCRRNNSIYVFDPDLNLFSNLRYPNVMRLIPGSVGALAVALSPRLQMSMFRIDKQSQILWQWGRQTDIGQAVSLPCCAVQESDSQLELLSGQGPIIIETINLHSRTIVSSKTIYNKQGKRVWHLRIGFPILYYTRDAYLRDACSTKGDCRFIILISDDTVGATGCATVLGCLGSNDELALYGLMEYIVKLAASGAHVAGLSIDFSDVRRGKICLYSMDAIESRSTYT